jgi:hypothetical protein
METIDRGTVVQKRKAIRPSQMSHMGKRSVPIIDQCLLDRLDAEGILLDKISVDVLGLDNRQLRRLTAIGIRDIRQLSNCTEGDLLNIPHFGSFTVGQVKAKLNSYLKAILSGISRYPDEFRRDSGIERSYVDTLKRRLRHFVNEVSNRWRRPVSLGWRANDEKVNRF